MNINTFGKSPAAHYLTRLLIDLGDKQLTRACTVRLNYFNENVKSIKQSVDDNSMTAKVAANLFRMLREEATKIELEPQDSPVFKFVSQLLRNTIIGNIKVSIRGCTVIRKIENGNVSESKLKRVGKKLESDSDDALCNKGAKKYSILSYTAGYVFEQDKEPWRLMRTTPSLNEIKDLVTPEILHSRSLKRCKRMGKDWTKVSNYNFTELSKVTWL